MDGTGDGEQLAAEAAKISSLKLEDATHAGSLGVKTPDDKGVAGPPLPDLYFRGNHRWVPMPDWARFFLQVGSLVAEFSAADQRVVVGVAVPTRAYAASLIGAGAVLRLSEHTPGTPDPWQHFRELCKLPRGTSVTYRRGNKQLRGLIRGHETRGGSEYLILHLRSNERLLLDPYLCLKVQLANQQFRRVSSRQHGLEILQNRAFVETVIAKLDPYNFAQHSRLDCVLNGNVRLLRHEVTQTPWAARTQAGKLAHGTLQDVLRVRRFYGEGHHYRSDVVSGLGAKPESGVRQLGTAPVAVFDGAAAFLKWRHEWRSSSWITILDRTSALTLGGAATLNQDYAEQRLIDWPLPDDLTIPAGIELTGFVVRKA